MAKKKRRTTGKPRRRVTSAFPDSKYKTAVIIIAILAFVLVIAIMFGQKPSEELPPVLQYILPEEGELVAGATCDEGLISLSVANNLNEEIRLQNTADPNIRFVTNGIVDNEPGCGTDTLAPGDVTTCNEVGINLREGANQLVVYTKAQTFSQTVIC